MKALLFCLLCLAAAEWYIRRPSRPRALMEGEGRDFLSYCRDGGAP